MEIKDPMALVETYFPDAPASLQASEAVRETRWYVGVRTIHTVGIQQFHQDFNKHLAANGCDCAFPLGSSSSNLNLFTHKDITSSCSWLT